MAMLIAMSNAEFWNDKFHHDAAASQSIFAGEPNPIIADLLERIYPDHSAGSAPNAAAPRALDLGSGRGRHTVWLAKQGWETTALDFSDVGLAHTARALAAEQLDAHLLQADLNEWEPTPESFDAIVAAFMHLPSVDQRKLWEKVARALAPGGHLIVVAHHPENQIHGPQNPDLLYDAESVVAAFGAGFSAVVAERRITKEDGDRQAIDTVVLLRKA